jgi:hypothetical protein
VALACMTCGILCLRRHRLLGWLCITGIVVQVALVVGLPLLMQRWSSKPNHSIQRTGASRSAGAVCVAQWRLAPAADAGRYGYEFVLQNA